MMLDVEKEESKEEIDPAIESRVGTNRNKRAHF
jgi:hypothetical protein